ncbi:MAG: YqeG family HAD IIIA-type phosphatase [Bacteroidaceae bacterium]|nr:YqeG family HAD IIIA-type phosphatase [Bacteroidaceae bacterium]
MSFSLLPKFRVESVTELSPEVLKKLDIRLLILDFDNTIVPYTTNEPTEEMAAWLKMMAESDIEVCIVSNFKRDRVKIFCKAYGLNCITHAKKPFSKGISQCLEQYGMEAQYCALAGDQIYTDTLGANCCNVKSILVEAIDQHNIWLKLRHIAELPFIWLAYGRKLIINN